MKRIVHTREVEGCEATDWRKAVWKTKAKQTCKHTPSPSQRGLEGDATVWWVSFGIQGRYRRK